VIETHVRLLYFMGHVVKVIVRVIVFILTAKISDRFTFRFFCDDLVVTLGGDLGQVNPVFTLTTSVLEVVTLECSLYLSKARTKKVQSPIIPLLSDITRRLVDSRALKSICHQYGSLRVRHFTRMHHP
jgi:hypothetical protein